MKRTGSRGWMHYLTFPLTIIFLEFVISLHCFERILSWGALYTVLFSVVIGGLCAILASIWNRRINRAVSVVLMVLLTLVFGTQAVYFTIFKTFTGFYALALAGDAIGGFWKEAISGIWSTKFTLLVIFIPLIVNLFLGKRFIPERRLSFRYSVLLLFLLSLIQISTLLWISTNTTGIMSYRYVYYDTYSSILSVPRFGVLTTARLELQAMRHKDGVPDFDEIISSAFPEPGISESPSQEPVSTPSPVIYGENALDINFEKLIAEEGNSAVRGMHEYFSKQVPTKQNKYTGMFEGKNLIWIVAEGFSSGALDMTHTPTLYKLAHEGFKFNNFYNPIWYGSTSDGEFVTLTGLLPKAGKLSFKLSAENSMPFGFGKLLGDIGYTTKAYHDHTYTYYGRDKSHPNLGYDYMGVGNGLEITKQWPESDVEMIDQTTEHYVHEDNFHVYYLTVSGHLMYTFTGNMMAYKHRNDVADLPYSDNVRAYIACQMETDLAVKLLIERLQEAGKLEDTVIVLSGDHYPYGLETTELEEIGMPDDEFELYRSTLIIWNSEMETENVDKYCSSIDIMPTLANLFSLEYDSRLVSGRDVFSEAPALVIFNNRSWITELGRYNSSEDKFEANEGAEIPEGYAVKILKQVNEKFSNAAKIIEYDYYSKILTE